MLEIKTKAARTNVFEHAPTFTSTDTESDPKGITLTCAAPAVRFALRLRNGEVPAEPCANFILSQDINTLTCGTTDAEDAHYMSARLGPDEWLLLTEQQAASEIATSLSSELEGTSHSLVDISHRNVALELAGPRASDILNTGCPLDLSIQAFPPLTATRTIFAKCEVVLMRLPDRNGQPCYRLEAWRSFARYIRAFINNSTQLIGANRHEN